MNPLFWFGASNVLTGTAWLHVINDCCHAQAQGHAWIPWLMAWMVLNVILEIIGIALTTRR